MHFKGLIYKDGVIVRDWISLSAELEVIDSVH